MLKSLELFCGTKSFSKCFPGDTLTLDIDEKVNPDICIDILQFRYKQFPIGYFDIIWASPDCCEYSTCLTTRPRNLSLADSLVQKTLEIINYLQPKYWCIENPYTGLLKTREFMKPLQKYMKVVDYCKYGYNYRKRTAIWTNIDWEPRPLCRKDCGFINNNKHIGHFGTSSANIGLDQKHSIPPKLIMEILLPLTQSFQGRCEVCAPSS